MDMEFLKWLEAELDQALDLSRADFLTEDRQEFWQDHHNMLAPAVEEIKATMYKEATGQ